MGGRNEMGGKNEMGGRVKWKGGELILLYYNNNMLRTLAHL